MGTKVEAARQLVLANRAFTAAMLAAEPTTDAELAEITALVAESHRLGDGQVTAIAGEVLARDDRPGKPRFCRTLGYRSPSALLASMLGMRRGTAMSVLGVANAGLVRDDIDGASPAVLPQLTAALMDGSASLEQASAFIGGLGAALHRAEPALVAEADAGFVRLATDPEHPMVPEDLAQLARSLAATIDPEQIEPTYEDLRDMRRLTMSERDDGMTRFSGLLDPTSAATLKAAIDAYASPRRNVRFEEGVDHDLGEELGDPRTMTQRNADALTDICAIHAASGNAPTVGGEAPTLLVTATFADLANLAGEADAFGATKPRSVAEVLAGRIPSATAQLLHTGAIVPIGIASQMLCHGFMQLVIMSDTGEVLELGRSERLFSSAQKRAMITRDKTCQGPSCTVPAEWCEAHHIVWWSRGGPTDISNGIMLCRFCHTEVHAGRLQITARPTNDLVPRTAPSSRRPRLDRPPGSPPRAPHPWVVTRTASRPPRRLEPGRLETGRREPQRV